MNIETKQKTKIILKDQMCIDWKTKTLCLLKIEQPKQQLM